MITLSELLAESPRAAERPRVTSIGETQIREHTQRTALPTATSVHDGQVHTEQIHALVRQLFFRHESGPVRHVGFAPVEASTATATLCLQVARALAEEDRYDVGLIDTHSDSVLLETALQIPSPSPALATWPIGPRLWMVPRQSWLPDTSGHSRGHRITDQNLSRLRELTGEFDFSILWCAPVSWLTASIGQTCDGLVLVLTANKTRRLVAAQIKDQLSKTQVPLLGTVLVERRFPVPQGLYRSL
jgi:hypothetical protein